MANFDWLFLKNRVNGNTKRRLVQLIAGFSILTFFGMFMSADAILFYGIQWKWVLGALLLWIIILIDPSNKTRGL